MKVSLDEDLVLTMATPDTFSEKMHSRKRSFLSIYSSEPRYPIFLVLIPSTIDEKASATERVLFSEINCSAPLLEVIG